MAKFIYEAKTSPGKIIHGSIVAENAKLAVEQLGKPGFFLLSIKEENKAGVLGNFSRFFFNRIKSRDSGNFIRQLSDLLESGLTVVRSLEVLERQTENPRMSYVVREIKQACVDGRSLSEAISRHPRAFSPMFVSIVRSGEAGGALDEVLRKYSSFNDKELETRSKIRAAMAYPALMACMGLLTILVLVTFVVPKMSVMLEDAGHALPLPTAILMGLSRGFTRYAALWAAGLTAGMVLLSRFYTTERGRFWFDEWRLKLPMVGPLHKKVQIARFANTLAVLLANGVSLLESIRTAADTVTNRVLRTELLDICESVKKGLSISRAFAAHAVFPEIVKNMIAVGEESGKLEKALFKVAEVYDRENDTLTKTLLSLLEPLMILVLGAIVAFIVAAMLLPIFELSFI